jgi:hypothetical protein
MGRLHVEAEDQDELDRTRVLVLIRPERDRRRSGMAVAQMKSGAADVIHGLDGKVMQLVH